MEINSENRTTLLKTAIKIYGKTMEEQASVADDCGSKIGARILRLLGKDLQELSELDLQEENNHPKLLFGLITAKIQSKVEEAAKGWIIKYPGYVIFQGVSKREKRAVHITRFCDARDGEIKIWTDPDFDSGIPHEIVLAAIHSIIKND